MLSRIRPDWPARPPDVRWGLREVFVCLVVAQLLAPFWAAGIFEAAGQELTDSPRNLTIFVSANLGLWVAYLAGSVLISRRLGRGPRIDFDIGISAGESVRAVAIGIALQLVVLPVLYWPITRFFDADPGESARLIVDLVDGPVDLVILTAAVVVVAPIVEEIFYRGLLLPALTRAGGPLVGLLGSAFIFALVHQQLIVIPGLTVFGLVVAWLTATSGRIGPAIVTHMAFNATTVFQLLVVAQSA